jgi:acetolactate synthase-1/2/3 large subunit
MATLTGGDLVARVLREAGVTTLFTLCGGHIAPIYDGCITEGIRIIDTRHEQAAAFAADAWARLTQGIGIAAVTAGPGVANAVTAVANADLAGSPLLLLGGAAPTDANGRGALQEMEQVNLLRPITKWSTTVSEVRRVPETLATAIRIATTGRLGPVFVELPFDVLGNTVAEDRVRIPRRYGGPTITAAAAPPLEAIRQAAHLLRAARQPVLMAGSPVYWDDAHEVLANLAGSLHLPVYLNGMGRGCLPWDHPCFLQHTRSRALKGADLVLLVGTPLDFRMKYGESINPSATLLQIEPDGTLIGRNRDVDLGLIGDTRLILAQLNDELSSDRPDWGDWLSSLRTAEAERVAKLRPVLNSDAEPMHHYRFAAAIDALAQAYPSAILVGDGGDIVATVARVVRLSAPGQWLDPGPLGCLGIGVPFAIAAQALYPERRVIVISGDGSFGLNGFELETAARFGMPIVVVIGNDRGWGQIRNPQLAIYGPDRAVATTLGDTRYERMAAMFDGHAEYVERPEELEPAMQRALASHKPAIVNALLDPQALLTMEGAGSYVL